MVHNILATIDLDKVIAIAKAAGAEILKIYEEETMPAATLKTDLTPLTIADTNANYLIVEQLLANFPDIPVISEEVTAVDFAKRQAWKAFWLVDPLDGTREFLDRNGEFTVNIALIIDNRPALGVIHAPALNLTFFGSRMHGACKQIGLYEPKQIFTRPNNKKMVAVHSRSHSTPEEERVLTALGARERLQIGSSLKFCLIADGTANYYYRHGQTMEWDTAAGQAIVEAAGGSVTTPDRLPLLYNKESLKNGSFLCMA